MKENRKPSSPESTPIHWEDLHRRLNAARIVLEQGLIRTPEEKKKLLRARAAALARPPDRAPEGEAIEVVEFLLAYERYGIESSCVREVYPLKDLTPLPGVPPHILGIVNVRGQIVSVMDLKKFFDLPERGLTDLNKLILVRSGGGELGILADSILGVRSFPCREIQPPLPTLTGIRAEYLRGIAKDNLVVLDANKILADRNLVVDQQVES